MGRSTTDFEAYAEFESSPRELYSAGPDESLVLKDTIWTINNERKVGTREDPVQSGIAYDTDVGTMRADSVFNYDSRWLYENGYFDYTPPTNPIYIAELDQESISPFHFLKNNNAFGTKDRFTNSIGEQDYSIAPANGAIGYYAIDHLTGLGWYLVNQIVDVTGTVYGTFEQHLASTINSTLCGFNDWFTPTMTQLDKLVNQTAVQRDGVTAAWPFGRPFFTNNGTYWSNTVNYSNNTQVRTYNPFSVYFLNLATQSNLLSHLCRNHYV